MDGKDLSKLPLSALQPATLSQIDGPKKRLTVSKRGDYPSKGFPDTLERLQVFNLNFCHFVYISDSTGGRYQTGQSRSTHDQASPSGQSGLEQQ